LADRNLTRLRAFETVKTARGRRRLGVSGLAVALGLILATGCAARPGVPRPFPGAPVPPTTADAPPPRPEPEPGVPPTAAPVAPLLETALTFRGTPYRYGGSDPSGFDCSGFVQWVFARYGMALPREVRDQYRIGRDIDRDDVLPGDLVFFETVSRGASHVGIALGGGEFVHAPSSRGVVRVERYDGAYWSSRWVGARRLSGDAVEAD
jgi:cell wall-associated NlpC family hydrolase